MCLQMFLNSVFRLLNAPFSTANKPGEAWATLWLRNHGVHHCAGFCSQTIHFFRFEFEMKVKQSSLSVTRLLVSDNFKADEN